MSLQSLAESGKSQETEGGQSLESLKLPRLVRLILERSGIENRSDFDTFVYPQLKKLRDPLSLADMGKAVDRLIQALREQESVCLYGDYDLDGTSGLALCHEAFVKLGFNNLHLYQPDRFTEGYGLHCSAIEKLKSETGCTVMVSIDLGITAHKEADFAKSLGIDLIITDHHLPTRNGDGAPALPSALAVVNPNRGDCTSDLGHLCGAGVIFYTVLALRRSAVELGLCTPQSLDPKDLLDLFAIGTVTDLVPLMFENRVLVKHGLLRLAKTVRPALRELMKSLDLFGRPLTALDLGMRLAPKLNALSRMGSDLTPLQILLESDERRAREYVDSILANNKVRQERQSEAIQEAELWVEAQAQRGARDPILVVSETFHRGIVGLVATRLAERFQVPSFVGSVEGNQVIGSARIPRGSDFHLLEAMRSVESHFIQFGGHRQAAGFEAELQSVEALRSGLIQFSRQLESESKNELNGEASTDVNGADSIESTQLNDQAVDCRLSEINEPLMAWLDLLEPFGVGFSVPRFRVQNALVASARFLKGDHLKLSVVDSGAKTLDAIWFSPLNPDVAQVGARLDLEVELQWNYFRGERKLQLMVCGAKASAVSTGSDSSNGLKSN